MDENDIFHHWLSWATEFGTELRATTKTWTAKAIEVDAFARRILELSGNQHTGTALEIGCGNGVNCIELAGRFSNMLFDGIDYVPEMVNSARKNSAVNRLSDRLRFFQGDALSIKDHKDLRREYDFVFTDRCLINLNSADLQKRAIAELATLVRPGGYLLMIENSQQTYEMQNRCREIVGLQPRSPAAFNTFFDESEIVPHLEAVGLELEDVEDFISLHDIVLYVLVPAINGGEVDYNHPLVEAATRLNIGLATEHPGAFGAFGQNRMFVCRKPH